MKKEFIYINNEKLRVPVNHLKKCISIFQRKELKFITFEETLKSYILIFQMGNIFNYNHLKKAFKRYKIVKNIKKDDDKIYVKLNKYSISYYYENLTEKYIKHPHWDYFYKLNKKIKTTKTNPFVKKIDLDNFENGHGTVLEIKDFLTQKEVDIFRKQIDNQKAGDVPADGKFNTLVEYEKIGAQRSYIYSKQFSKILKKRVLEILPEEIIVTDRDDSIDYLGHKRWRLKVVNPLLRIIAYKQHHDKVNGQYGGRLVPHYDYPYDKNEKERSLRTLVMYLTTNTTGATRYLKDDIKEILKNKKIYTKDYNDRDYIPKKSEILSSVLPEMGKAIIFEHRLLHDAEEIQTNEEKIIIFTDIIYEKI
jgi:hypothetical protein